MNCKDCIHKKVCVIRGFPSAFENTRWEKEPCDHFESKTEWISVDERLPDDYNDYLVVVKHKYECEDEWEYDVDVGGPTLGDDGYIDHFWKTYHDWEVGKECHITHWMPLPEPPMMKGGE